MSPTTLGTMRLGPRAVADRWNRLTANIAGRRYGLYGLAVMRIGYGVILLVLLLGNFAARQRIWGVGSEWLRPYRLNDGYQLPFTLLDHVTSWWFFDLWYVLTVVLAVAFLVGYRTRIVTPLLYIAFTTLWRQNLLVEDGGERLVRIMLIFLVFADISARWSLDARRRASLAHTNGRVLGLIERLTGTTAAQRWRTRSTVVGNLLNNFALATVVGQLCLVYLCAGLYKVQGSMWQDGTAIYYPLRLDSFAPWPGLSALVYSSPIVVTLITYFSVLVQVAFPFMLVNRISRRVILIAILGMHIGIAVLMGLPLFSAAMAFADLVLVRGVTYRWLADRVTALMPGRCRRRARQPALS